MFVMVYFGNKSHKFIERVVLNICRCISTVLLIELNNKFKYTFFNAIFLYYCDAFSYHIINNTYNFFVFIGSNAAVYSSYDVEVSCQSSHRCKTSWSGKASIW